MPLEKAADKLMDKANKCRHLASDLHETAYKQQACVDRQHESASDLEIVGRALEADAAALKGKVPVGTERISAVKNWLEKASAD